MHRATRFYAEELRLRRHRRHTSGDCQNRHYWGSYNDAIDQKDYQELVYSTIIADGRAEVMRAARQNFRNGASVIKVMAGGGVASTYDPLELVGYTAEELQAIVQGAND